MKKIIIASPNVSLRKSLKLILESTEDIRTYFCHRDVRNVQDSLDSIEPQFLIVDLLDDLREGKRILKSLKKELKKVNTICLTNLYSPDTLLQLFRYGINALLEENNIFNELYRCIYTINLYNVYISQTILAEIIEKEKNRHKAEKLSQMEIKHLKYIADGKTSKEIAFEMKITPRTADYYKSKIMEKMDFKSIPDLVKYALKIKLISL